MWGSPGHSLPITPTLATMSRLSASAVLLVAMVSMAAARMAYVLPDGAESLLRARSFQETFSCENLPYGYYADVDNNCELFHVCLPIAGANGEVVESAHFTFICGNQTVFSQESLTCTHPDAALACEESPALFEITNSLFGVLDDQPASFDSQPGASQPVAAAQPQIIPSEPREIPVEDVPIPAEPQPIPAEPQPIQSAPLPAPLAPLPEELFEDEETSR